MSKSFSTLSVGSYDCKKSKTNTLVITEQTRESLISVSIIFLLNVLSYGLRAAGSKEASHRLYLNPLVLLHHLHFWQTKVTCTFNVHLFGISFNKLVTFSLKSNFFTVRASILPYSSESRVSDLS